MNYSYLDFIAADEFVKSFGSKPSEENKIYTHAPKFPDLTIQKPKASTIQTVTPYDEAKAHIKEILDRLKQNKTESPKDIFDDHIP